MSQVYTVSINGSSSPSYVDEAFFNFVITQKKASLEVRCAPHLIEKLCESVNTVSCNSGLSEPGNLRWKYATCSVRCVIDFDLTEFQCIADTIV